MMKLNNNIEIKVNKAGQNSIEQFVEEISDKLMINDTYFGSLISVINELFSLIIDNQPNTKVNISYYTDYQSLTVVTKNVSRETSSILENVSEEDANINAGALIIHNLTENVEIDENQISLTFDIGAMNQMVYNHRKLLLNDYLTGKPVKKSITSHDQF